MLLLDEGCRLQCRLIVESRTNPYLVRTDHFLEAPISVYFTVRLSAPPDAQRSCEPRRCQAGAREREAALEPTGPGPLPRIL
jgi:hypothetical protein